MNKFKILDYYLKQNKNPKYVDEYQSTSAKKSGCTFWHTNVNFRTLFSFVDTFTKFSKYDSRDRKDWDVYSNKEVKAKHWTVRMQQSKLFKLYNKNKKNNTYKLTAKGEAFKDFVNIINDSKFYFSENEKWSIIYNFVLNSYFDLKPNYILKKPIEIYNVLVSHGFEINYINQIFLDLLKKSDGMSKDDLFKFDAFWILTFYKDKDFLELYKSSSLSEKKELSDYAISCSHLSKKEIIQKNDLISKKYIPGGQYLISTFIDDVKTLYISYNLQQLDNIDCVSLITNIYFLVNKFDSTIQLKKMKEFVLLHKDVFEVIFNEAILNKNIDTEINNLDDCSESIENVYSEDKIDDTTIKNQKQLRKTSQILKRITKEKNDYHCELENLNSCKYFTSKENGKNYLEIHHLIPFEFSNDFDSTLEVIENYVALCPYCHRLLHFGVDRERNSALTYLYNQRKTNLKNKGLDLKLKDLLSYYGFDESTFSENKKKSLNEYSKYTYEQLLLMIRDYLKVSNSAASSKIAEEFNVTKKEIEQILLHNANIFKVDQFSNWSLI